MYIQPVTMINHYTPQDMLEALEHLIIIGKTSLFRFSILMV